MRRRREQSIEIQQMRYFEEQQQKVRKKIDLFTKLMHNPQGLFFYAFSLFRELTSGRSYDASNSIEFTTKKTIFFYEIRKAFRFLSIPYLQQVVE
jgi:hypothetical protein